MARAIDSEVAYRFLTEQLVKETGAFSKGVNKGLNIARSAMRNPDAIPTITPPNEWVSVEERLPEVGQEVLVYWRNTSQKAEHFELTHYEGDHWFSLDNTVRPWIVVVAWMPLPAPPGKGNNVPTNEPLTIEQLREMDGEPVWVVLVNEKWSRLNGWYLVHHGSAYLARVDDWELDDTEYGVEWIAYRRPPEGEA